jgi:hypothetical protein
MAGRQFDKKKQFSALKGTSVQAKSLRTLKQTSYRKYYFYGRVGVHKSCTQVLYSGA